MRAPDIRLINLETSVTQSDHYWLGKGINYRMNPDNIACLTEARIACCSLANDHTWGYEGLSETLQTLNSVQIKTVGAGKISSRLFNRPFLRLGKKVE